MPLSKPAPRRRVIFLWATLAAFGLAATIVMVSMRRKAPPAAVEAKLALPHFTAPSPPAKPEKQLRPELFEALGYGTRSPWPRRLDLIRKLPVNLSAVETDAMLTAMMEPCPPSEWPGTYSSYMHEMACILQPRQDIREPFARALATLARDTRRDQATRDYAIQHLRQVWSRAEQDSALRAAIVGSFHEFTRLDTVVATPAMLALHLLGTVDDSGPVRVAQEPASAPPADAPKAHDLTDSFQLPDTSLISLLDPIFATKTSTANIPARLSAFRIAGERRMSAFRQPLLAAIQDRSEHAMVRMAAVNAIGKIADPADLKTLATLPIDDFRVDAAVKHALQTRASQ